MTKSSDLSKSVNDNSIPGERLEDSTVTSDKLSLSDNSISGSFLINDSVPASKIQGGGGGGDAANVTYTPDFTNADTRSVKEKLEDSVSITDFGAIGDDDPANANTNRIAIIRALATGKAVYVPSGRYYFNNSGPSNGFGLGAGRILYGDGPSSVLIQSNGSAWIRTSGSDVQVRDLTLETFEASLIVSAGDINISDNSLSIPSHGLLTANGLWLSQRSGSTLAGGLANNTTYFAIKVDDNTVKLATSVANAVAGTAVDITSAGSDNGSGEQFLLSAGAAVGMFISGSNQKNILIENVRFFKGNQRVYLGNVSQVRVVNCTFQDTGYGVIQRFNTTSNDVLVTGCNAINIRGDFVEANCTGMNFTYTAIGGETTVSQSSPGTKTGDNLKYFPGIEQVFLNGSGTPLVRGTDYTALDGVSINMLNPASLTAGNTLNVQCAQAQNWAITNNVMEKTDGYPFVGTEDRFVGITGVHGVVIDGNVATNCSGDSFVHLEAVGGEGIVSNNFFMNLASGFGHVFLIRSTWHVIITGNTFKQVDPNITNPQPCVYSSNNNTNDITFTNNRVIGAVGGPDFSGFATSFQTGRKIIANNIFENLTSVMGTSNVSNVTFSGNVIRNCQGGITGPSGSGARFSVFNNTFEGTTDMYDIDVRSNSSGARAPRNWIVQGNRFGKGASFAGNGLPGGNGELRDIYISNNILESGATGIFIGGTRTRVRESGNTSEADASTNFSFTTARFEPQAAAPSSPTEGQVYYDNPTNKLRVWNGSSWDDLN